MATLELTANDALALTGAAVTTANVYVIHFPVGGDELSAQILGDGTVAGIGVIQKTNMPGATKTGTTGWVTDTDVGNMAITAVADSTVLKEVSNVQALKTRVQFTPSVNGTIKVKLTRSPA